MNHQYIRKINKILKNNFDVEILTNEELLNQFKKDEKKQGVKIRSIDFSKICKYLVKLYVENSGIYVKDFRTAHYYFNNNIYYEANLRLQDSKWDVYTYNKQTEHLNYQLAKAGFLLELKVTPVIPFKRNRASIYIENTTKSPILWKYLQNDLFMQFKDEFNKKELARPLQKIQPMLFN